MSVWDNQSMIARFVEQKKKYNIQSVPRVENFFLRLEKDYGK